MDRGSEADSPRAWARPDLEGDPWHDYWEPDGAADQRARLGLPALHPGAAAEQESRRRFGRRVSVGYLIVTPIALVINLLAWRLPGAPVGAAVCGFATLIGLIRIWAYGERSRAITAAMAVLLLAWIAILVAHIW